MKEPFFDIFKGPSEKNAVWIEAVEGLSNARERMEQIAAENPGEYFLFSTSSHSILARIETLKKPASGRNVDAAYQIGGQPQRAPR